MALISIIIHVHNQAGNPPETLPGLVSRLVTTAALNARHLFEFIYIDNGSRNGIYSILKDLAENDRRVRVVKLSRSFAKTAAYLAGLTYASGDCVAFMDSDLQDPPEALTEMIDRWMRGSKVVLATRRRGISGYYLLDRLVAEILLQSAESRPSLAGIIAWTGYELDRVSIPRDQLAEMDQASRSKRGWGSFAGSLRFTWDTLAYSSDTLLRLGSGFGFLLSIAAGAIFLILLIGSYQILASNSMTILFLIASSVELMLLSLIGWNVNRMFDATRKRPPFVVDSVLNEPPPNPETSEKIDNILNAISSSTRWRKSGGTSPLGLPPEKK